MNSKILLIAWFALGSQPGFACKCGSPKNIQQAISIYDIVFHGKAIRSEVVQVELQKKVWQENRVTFVTDTVFKGNVSDTIVIKNQGPMNMCSSNEFLFKIGESYFIGYDKPSIQKIRILENGKKLFTTNHSLQYEKVYPELDDCGYVQWDSPETNRE